MPPRAMGAVEYFVARLAAVDGDRPLPRVRRIVLSCLPLPNVVVTVYG